MTVRAKGKEEVTHAVTSTTDEHLTGSHLQPPLAAREQRRGGTQAWGPVLTCLSLFLPFRPKRSVQTLEVYRLERQFRPRKEGSLATGQC